MSGLKLTARHSFILVSYKLKLKYLLMKNNRIITKVAVLMALIGIMPCSFVLQGKSGTTLLDMEDYNPQPSQIILPSPQSQLYTRFGGYQPNFATGAVNVNIPLHTLSWGDFSLPLELCYQTNGIKPTDPYFPLGYGWMLNPGLRITRTVFGKTDEKSLDRDIDSHRSDIAARSCYFDRLLNEAYSEDSQYDVFTICLPSGNTPFLIRNVTSNHWMPNWEALTVASPLRIQVLQNSDDLGIRGEYIHGFIITDENGIIYYFGNDEQGIVAGVNQFVELSAARIPTAYLLRKVVLPGSNNNTINFAWNVNEITYSEKFSECYVFENGLFQNNSYSGGPTDLGEKKFWYKGNTDYTSSLARISCPMFNVNFDYEIMPHGYLRNIEIKNARNEEVKNIKFKFSNKLMECVKIGDEVYTFDYNSKKFEYTKNCWDYWGYYNGKNNKVGYPSYDYTPWKKTYQAHISGADMTSDEVYMKANILEVITYPTGGTTSFSYEAHQYDGGACGGGPFPVLHEGGGLRVKQVRTSSGGQSPDIIKTYKYGLDEDGKGICTVEPNVNGYITEELFKYETTDGSEGDFAYRLVTLHPECVYGFYYMLNLPVWYRTVTEYSSVGKTVFKYDYDPDNLRIMDNIPFYDNSYWGGLFGNRLYPSYMPDAFQNISTNHPRLIQKTVHDASGKVVEDNNYIYNHISGPCISSISLRKMGIDLQAPQCTGSDYNEYDYLINSFNLHTYKLGKKVTTKDGGTTSEEYRYSQASSGVNLQSVTTQDSEGHTITDEFKYVEDQLSDYLSDDEVRSYGPLYTYNRKSLPVIQVRNIDGKQVYYKQIRYWAQEGFFNYIPYVVPSQEIFKTEDSVTETRLCYNHCTKDGKVMEVVADGKYTSYLWGYAGDYPIAEIKNAKYEEVEQLLGTELINRLCLAVVPDNEDMDKVEELRPRLPHAMVTTYTYKPLVGILSQTTPAGQSLFYSYDGNGRLTETYRQESVSSDKNSIKEKLQSFKYNY